MDNKVKAVTIYLKCMVDNEEMLTPLHKGYDTKIEEATNTLLYIVTLLDSKRLPSMNIGIGKDVKEVSEENLPLLDQIGDDLNTSIDQIRGIHPEENHSMRMH